MFCVLLEDQWYNCFFELNQVGQLEIKAEHVLNDITKQYKITIESSLVGTQIERALILTRNNPSTVREKELCI